MSSWISMKNWRKQQPVSSGGKKTNSGVLARFLPYFGVVCYYSAIFKHNSIKASWPRTDSKYEDHFLASKLWFWQDQDEFNFEFLETLPLFCLHLVTFFKASMKLFHYDLFLPWSKVPKLFKASRPYTQKETDKHVFLMVFIQSCSECGLLIKMKNKKNIEHLH